MNQIIDLLKKRGFIIETENNQYILSDNSAKKDAKHIHIAITPNISNS